MVTVQEIKEKRRELQLLEDEYLRETPPCINKQCGLYNIKSSGHCQWSVLLEDCNDYKHED